MTDRDVGEARWRMWVAGMTDPEIAEAQGVPVRRVCKWRRGRGLPSQAARMED